MIITKQAQRSVRLFPQKRLCIFLVDPRFGIRLLLLKLLLNLNLQDEPKTHYISGCGNPYHFYKRFQTKSKRKAGWKKSVAELYTVSFSSGLMGGFIFIYWISPDFWFQMHFPVVLHCFTGMWFRESNALFASKWCAVLSLALLRTHFPSGSKLCS